MANPPAHLRNLSHKGASVSKTGLVPGKLGGLATTFNVNFASAKAPQRTYSAETCSLQYRNGEVYFVFGQRTLTGDALDSAISLRMHGFYARQVLKSIDAMSEPGLDEIARLVRIEREPLDRIEANPNQLAKLSSNIVQVAVSGHDTCLDFYQISPQSVMKAKVAGRGGDVDLIPVARVDVRTSIFLSLVDELRNLSENFPRIEQEEASV